MRVFRTCAAVVLGASAGSLSVIVPSMHLAPPQPVVAFVPRTTGTNLAEDMRRGARAAVQQAGYRLYWNAPTREDDVDRQILLAEGVVHRGPRALILGSTNPRGLTTTLENFRDAECRLSRCRRSRRCQLAAISPR